MRKFIDGISNCIKFCHLASACSATTTEKTKKKSQIRLTVKSKLLTHIKTQGKTLTGINVAMGKILLVMEYGRSVDL